MNDAARIVLRSPPNAKFGLAVVSVYLFAALFAPMLAPFSETEIVGAEFEPWGGEFLFGTDNLGRDMLTRLIFGARNTVGIAFITTALAFSAGVAGGLFAAARGGWTDQILSRFVDMGMAIPPLIFALLMLTIFGTGVAPLILVIAAIQAFPVFRIARAVTMDIAVMEYVEAAKVRGESLLWITAREILPNAAPPLVAEFGLRFVFIFLFISALSFLGLGLQPPIADWGGMVRENATLITFGDITPLLPAGAIALLTVAVNFVVDWLLHLASGLKK
ncbi:MAG: ABC transporter permease [Gammaproteobacteria bacterium]